MLEVTGDDKRFVSGKVDDKGRLRCPMCKGRGYFEPTERGESDATDENCPLEEESRGKCSSLKLPAVIDRKVSAKTSSQRKRVTLPSIGKSKNFPGGKAYEGRNIRSDETVRNSDDELGKVASGRVLRGRGSKPKTANSNSNESDTENGLLPSPKTPPNPQELFKASLLKLKSSDWNTALSGLRDVIQVSRYRSDVLEGSMAVVYRGVTVLLKSFRSKITRAACQAAGELFSNVPSTLRPEFDELINALLQKSADTNKFVRRDANEALDSMVINILPMHTVRILVQKGICHRNSVARAAAARLLVCVVGLVGVNGIYSGNKETRNRIMIAGAQCLHDGCQDVRSYGCRIMKMLMEHEDFDEVLHANVNSAIINRIEKTLITIKYRK